MATSASSNPQLDPADKLPVHVTGLFSVEGKDTRLTWVPGFYRTFSTREHALLCQEQARRIFKVAETDLELAGMWYIFFQPEEITGMRWGSLYFGSKPRSAIAVDRKIEVKATRRFQRDKAKTETVYLAFLDLDEGLRIWEDLHIDWEQAPAAVA